MFLLVRVGTSKPWHEAFGPKGDDGHHVPKRSVVHAALLPLLQWAPMLMVQCRFPIPASAQFLNVIESVFSGMARAIIHCSDYDSKEAAQAAIDRYFEERNQHFRNNPKRAGKKIWGVERVPAEFNESKNCKDPAYSYC